MRRTITAFMIAIGLSVAALTAVTDVTFVLTNGQRHSGSLVYKGTGEIGLVSGGQERMFRSATSRPSFTAMAPRRDASSNSCRQRTILRISSATRSSSVMAASSRVRCGTGTLTA